MAYITNAALRAYLGMGDSAGPSDPDDPLLDAAIATAQESIEGTCRQTFEAAADTTRYFSPASYRVGGAVDGRDLILDAPLCQLTSVVNGDGVTVSAGNYITVPINAPRWYSLRLKGSSGLFWTYGTDIESDLIAVTGRWAYSVTPPVTIIECTKQLAAYLYRRRENANDLDRKVIIGDTTIFPAQLPTDMLTLLQNGGLIREAV